MPLITSPVLSSDLEAVHQFHLSIHDADEKPIVGRLAFLNGASDIQSVAGYVERSRRCMSDPKSTLRRVVARDDGDAREVVGYALWSFVRDEKQIGGGVETTTESTDAGGSDGEEWSGDVEKGALEGWIGGRGEKRWKLMGGKPHAYLVSLLTSPGPRSQEAALELIKWGLSLADAHHLPTFVEASPASRNFFLEYGFEEADALSFDLRPWGGAHIEEYSLLSRPAPSLPLPGTIVISSWLTNADLVSFPDVEDAAFGAGSPLSDIMFGEPPTPHPQAASSSENAAPPPPSMSEADIEFAVVRIGDQIDHVHSDPTARCVKAFDPATGQIVAVAQWHFYLSPSTDAHVFPPFRYPPAGNPKLGAHFFGSLLRTQDVHMRGQAYLFMRLLVVLPSHQGRGIGTRLLRWGLEQADLLGVRAWIDASPAGLGLYKKLGWEEVERLEVKLEEWGGKEGETDVTVSLVREPRKI